jgi:hypothetical protein
MGHYRMGHRLPEKLCTHKTGPRSLYIAGRHKKERHTVILQENVCQKAWKDQERLKKQREEARQERTEIEDLAVEGMEVEVAESAGEGMEVDDNSIVELGDDQAGDVPLLTNGLCTLCISLDSADDMHGTAEWVDVGRADSPGHKLGR